MDMRVPYNLRRKKYYYMKIEILLLAGLTICLSVYSNDSIPRAEDYFKDESSSQEISVPENFDNNLDSLLQEWHIKTFTNIDQNCVCDSINPEVSDEVIMKRLAEMPTIISLPYNKVIRQFIDMYSVKKRKQVSVMLGISNYYFPIFEQALERYNMPNELKYMAVIESALNPNAVSRAGATGIWQFMFGTGKVYGLEINSLVDERRDPIKETDAAVRYMKDLYGIFGDWHLAIAAYNCGPGNVNKAIRRSGGKKDYWSLYYYLPRETRGYVPLFIAANYIMTYNKEHLICPVQTDYPLHTDTLLLNDKMYFDQISAVIGIPKEELKMLNPQYRRDIIPATQERPLTLCMPANYTLSFIDNQDSISNFMADVFLNQLTVQSAANVKSAAPRCRIYKVRRGDTLSEIASHHHVTVTKLKRWNNIRSSRIQPGQRLKIY